MTVLNKIKQNAETYRSRVFGRDGSIVINHDQTVNQIFAGVDLTTLSYAELQEVGYILVHVSRNVGLNAVIENDHIEYWSLVNAIALSSTQIDSWIGNHNPLFSYIDAQVVLTLQRKSGSVLQFPDGVNKRFQNTLLQELRFYHGSFPAVWSGFAYLEGLCRRICSAYVTTDGKVMRPFKVCGRQYRSEAGKKRAKGRNKGTSTISNLHHTLELTRRHVSDHARRVLARFFRDYSAAEIFVWRNDSLHGSEDRQTTIIVLYCLLSILLLDVV